MGAGLASQAWRHTQKEEEVMHKASPTVLVTAVWVILAGAVAVPVAGQPILHVDDDASTGGDGLSWGTAFKHLQDALLTAGGDPAFTEIRVAGGVYKADQDEGGVVTPGDRLATFQLVDGVALLGGYAGMANPGSPDHRDINTYQSTLHGDLTDNDNPADFPAGPTFMDNTCRIVTGSGTGPATVLDGFTITAGNAEDPALPLWSGGGMFNDTGSPTVSHCTFVGNSASYSGAGMYNYWSTPTILHCTFAGNDGHYGGAMENVLADAVIVNCTFTGNYATGDS
jgi:hypothetical protein